MNLPDPKDKKNMTAQDLFEENLIQVFSKKTGLWIGTVRPGEEDNIKEYSCPVEVQKERNRDQLSIF